MKSFNLGGQPKKKAQTLSLVALMDIFTVLVFFLMFNVHSEQAVNMKRVTNMPNSALALEQLKMDARVEVLEIPNRQEVFLNNERIEVDEHLEGLFAMLDSQCRDRNEQEKCEVLAIEAPEDMDYTFVNRFVEFGNRSSVESVYLVVKQKH